MTWPVKNTTHVTLHTKNVHRCLVPCLKSFFCCMLKPGHMVTRRLVIFSQLQYDFTPLQNWALLLFSILLILIKSDIIKPKARILKDSLCLEAEISGKCSELWSTTSSFSHHPQMWLIGIHANAMRTF